MSLTGNGLVAIPISTATACGITIGNKVTNEIIMNEYCKHKEQFVKDQQTIKSFDNLYKKSLQDNLIDKSEYESLCNIFYLKFA